MPEWLQTILAVSGSGSLLGLAVAAVMRSLPYVAKARASVADTALVRAQAALVRAQAKKTSEAVAARQLDEFRAEMDRQRADMLTRITKAEAFAAAANERADDCENRNRVIIDGLLARIDKLEREELTRRTHPPPPLRRLNGERDDPSNARIELVVKSEGDKR